MTTRVTYPVKAAQREIVEVSGSFAPAGTGAPTAVRGTGFTVSRTGVGTFRVTFDRVFPLLVSAQATLQLSASADTQAQLGAVDLTAKTAVIRTITAGSDADISANANNRVNFTFKFRNSSR